MSGSIESYEPVWRFIENVLENPNEFFGSTSVVKKDRFTRELQILKNRLMVDLGGPTSPTSLEIASILEAIEKTNRPHRLFYKTIWVNKGRIGRYLNQILSLIPSTLWTEMEQIPTVAGGPPEKMDLGSPLAIGLMVVLVLGMLFYLALQIIYGTSDKRGESIFILAMCAFGVLVHFKRISGKWVVAVNILVFAAMCIGGPLFTIYFVGQFFGRW